MPRFILSFCLGFVALNACAQSEVFWNQTGAGNSPFVRQAILSGNGPAADVRIVQAGSGNRLSFRSQGEGNNATFRQVGDANQIDLNLTGNSNRYVVEQVGNQNLLSLPDVRSVNADVQLIQRGDGNQLIREGSLSVGVQMRIEQTGGMRLILTNGIR
jgi:hypothetical protein